MYYLVWGRSGAYYVLYVLFIVFVLYGIMYFLTLIISWIGNGRCSHLVVAWMDPASRAPPCRRSLRYAFRNRLQSSSLPIYQSTNLGVYKTLHLNPTSGTVLYPESEGDT